MTLSQIRRRIAEAVADDWTPSDPPEPSDVVQRIVKAGSRLPTFALLHRCLDDARRNSEVPYPDDMVISPLPWADNHRYRELLCWDLPPQPSSPPLLSF